MQKLKISHPSGNQRTQSTKININMYKYIYLYLKGTRGKNWKVRKSKLCQLWV